MEHDEISAEGLREAARAAINAGKLPMQGNPLGRGGATDLDTHTFPHRVRVSYVPGEDYEFYATARKSKSA